MNSTTQIALLLVLVLPFVLGVFVNVLNIGAIDPTVPREFSKEVKPALYKKSQQYLKEQALFGLVTDAIGLGIFLVAIFTGFFNFVDLHARGLGLGTVATGVVFSFILFSLSSILSLPFSLYETFVLEERYGFNKTTVSTFVSDRIKEYLITGILGGVIYLVLFLSFSYLGNFAWIVGWASVVVISVLMAFFAPVAILPMYNKFTPLPEGKLRRAIEKYALKEGLLLSGVFTIDSSRRSSKTNAFFAGFGKYKRVVLFDTLIADHTPEEVVSILAHETGHYRHKHILKLLAISSLSTLVLFFLLSRFVTSSGVFEFFRMDFVSVYAGIFFVLLLYSPLDSLTSVFINYFSRKFEYEADKYSIRSYEHPEAFRRALKKLAITNLTNLTPHPLKVFLEYSHPPILTRISHIDSVGRIDSK